ncbi:MAG: hypothetical protein ACKO38_02635 [Planctomycetota bacterium]
MLRRNSIQPSKRRGVILLVVLSLIVLFTLIAVTYAIVAGQYKLSAAASAKLQLVGDSPRKDLDIAAYMLIRDSATPSSFTGHSLLRDLYGLDGVRGVVTTATAGVNGQFIVLNYSTLAGVWHPQSGHYNGCVFTFISGDQRGFSTRVTGYNPTALQLQIETQDNDLSSVSLPAVGDEFLINGRPFNGTGFGYQPPIDQNNPGGLNAAVTTGFGPAAVSLLPHFAGYGTPTTIQTDVGGADESWDAVDNQNMQLAMVPPTAMSSNEIMPSFHRPDLIAYWIRQLHQSTFSSMTLPEFTTVFAYPYGIDGVAGTPDDSSAPWSNVSAMQRSAIIDFKRRFIFRPLAEDHPNFTGGNPSFTMLAGTAPGNLDCNGDGQVDRWDVDNDGDGIPDSVWVDPGLPIVTSRDGRQYKRLYAVLVRDMDGRVNLNAMGAMAHSNPSYTNTNITDPRSPGLNLAPQKLPRGLGVGPADADFAHLFGGATSGHFTQIILGRYGTDQAPGVANLDDPLSAVKSLGTPNDYNFGPQAFGSPPDLSGQAIIALDHHGQPIFANAGNAGETTDDPYETDPLRSRSEDRMFSVADFERLLRHNDADSQQLSQRMMQTGAAPNFFGNSDVRRMVTTLSSHIPASNVSIPFELRTVHPDTNINQRQFNYFSNYQNNAAIGASLLDLYRYRLAATGMLANNIPNELFKLVPFEILHGQKFDINRWFGNGLDDNGNGVVDEYEEEVAGEVVWPPNAPAQFRNSSFAYLNDNPLGPAPRQVYARQLYCLMRVLMNDQYVDPFNNAADVPAQTTVNADNRFELGDRRQELMIRDIAQWAINAVEFRDRDAVMSAFEYDVNPWNGWQCDGDPRTDESQYNYGSNNIDDDGDGQTDENDEAFLNRERRLIWGAELPDLLLMESVAFHNRGVRDTDLDPSQKKTIVNMKREDQDMDQFRIPQGSWFQELYCPRNGANNNRSLPVELYDPNTGNLDLGRLAPARQIASQQVRQPVWRVVVTSSVVPQEIVNRRTVSTFEPRDLLPANQSPERIIWFAPSDPGQGPEANKIYYGRTGSVGNAAPNQPALSNVQIPPQRYAVIGPRDMTVPTAFYAGNDNDPATYNAGAESLQINNGAFTVAGYPTGYPAAGNIQPPIGVVCAAKPPQAWQNQNRSVGMNISEPLPTSGIYYPEPNQQNDGRVPRDAYVDPAVMFTPGVNECPDRPFDTGGPNAAAYQALLGNSVTTRTIDNHRSIFLQRLANPLAPWNPSPSDPHYGANGMNLHDPSLAVNPYITIDSSTVDLTVYNGEDKNTQEQVMVNNMVVMQWRDQDDQDPFDQNPRNEWFCTRERGQRAAGANVDRNFWPPFSTAPRRGAMNLVDRCFPCELMHTLGFVNYTASDQPTVPTPGYEGAPDTTAAQPFPWLAWNNRPYANPLELMLVPKSAPGRLCLEFGMSPGNRQIYNGSATSNSPDAGREPYSYLLNFFLDSPSTPQTETPGYYRLFDHVETPSPFVGVEKWYHSAAFSNSMLIEGATFRPPFNRLSRFREPGRMNINTIFDFREWRALAHGFPEYDNTQFFNDHFVRSRRGYVASQFGSYPTIFANPFRDSTSSDLMPNILDMRKTGIEVGLLRPDPTSGNGSVSSAVKPLFASVSGQAYDNASRNPYFAYRGINRLSNLVTNHSNVYAMWITVGYFYVEPNPTGTDAAHVDGLRLAAEVGSDTGSIERHRGFYLIDRSIPVAFEAGEDHNVDRAILIRRQIE